MSRKDYKLIATELTGLLRREEVSQSAIKKIVDCLSYAFKTDNCRFDKQRFEDAILIGSKSK